MRNRFVGLGCLVLVGIIVVVLGAVALFAATLPPVSQQLPPNSGPLLVNLTTPLDSSDVPLNSPTSIQAEALGASSIVSLELWVDGNPAETKNAPKPDLQQFDAFWSWQPNAPGEHTLVARATDAAHHVVNSNVVRINATPDQDTRVPANYQVQSGDTLASLAQKLDTTPAQIAAANPQMNTSSPIAAGQTISVPHKSKLPKTNSPTPTLTPQPTAQPTAQASNALPASAPSGVSFWMQKNLEASVLLPPAPKLQIAAKGCNAELTLLIQASNVNGFFVYRTDAGNPQFKRIATLAAPSTPSITAWSFEDTNVAGPLEYYVSAFNPAGESPSNIASVSVAGSACSLAQTAASPLQFANGQIVTVQPIDKAYCYLAENSGPWSRMPPAPGTFIYPTNGAFDVGAYLKTIASAGVTSQMTMDLDCWGWRGDALSYLGEAKQTFSPQPNASIQVANDKFRLVGALNLPSNIKPFDPVQTIFPPNSLNTTGDPSVCSAHMDPLTVLFGGAQLCASSVLNHYVVLVWNWDANVLSPTPLVKDIDGYRVFENDTYYQHVAVATTSAGPAVQVTMFPLPAVSRFAIEIALLGADANRCFVVRAYKGTLESSDSNTVCLGSSLPGAKTVDLTASQTKLVWNQYTNFCAAPNPGNVYGGGGLIVGYHFENHLPGAFTCGGHLNQVLRTLASFPVSQQINGSVWHAVLKYQFTQTATVYGDNEYGRDPNRLITPVQYPPNRSCAVELMLATQAWDPATNNNTDDNLVPANDYIALPELGSSFSVDVTSAVRQWKQYGGNYGFEFRGANEDTGIDDDSDCLTHFASPVLEVTFFPSSGAVPNLAPPGLSPGQP